MADRYVALIRGINVGRAKRVAMVDLRELVAGLGCRHVRTVLNSGNVVFTAARDKPDRIAGRVQQAMVARLGVSAAVMVLTSATFSAAIDENELAAVADDPARLLVAFCVDAVRLKQLEPLMRQDWRPEALAIGGVAAYLWCPAGILAGRLLEAVGRTLGEATTTRNWRTVTKIQAALQVKGNDQEQPG